MQTFRAFALLDPNDQLFNQQIFTTKRELIEKYTGARFGTAAYKKKWVEMKQYGYSTCRVMVTVETPELNYKIDD